MSVHIATRSSVGLRAQAAGGQTVLDGYQTIHHYLRQTMSAMHANLFAEPNARGLGGDVDWYTPIDSPSGASLLTQLPPSQRSTVVERLGSLLNDIRVRAADLKNSPKQSDRLLGQLLLLSTEVPGEDCAYAVGDQPVLIFWGHLPDVPAPEHGVLDRMITRLAPTPAASPPPAAAPAPANVAREAQPLPHPNATQPAPPVAVEATIEPTAGRTRYPWLIPTLWGVFGLLCIAIGLELLKGCGIGWPFQGSSLWINYCPMPSNPNAAELADLEAQNAQLQSQLDRLLGNVSGRRQQCALASRPALPSPKVVPPPTPEPPKVEFTIPPDCQGDACLAVLSGCRGDDDMQYETQAHRDNVTGENVKATATPARVTFCFNNPDRPGEGQFSLKTKEEPTIVCQTHVTAVTTSPGHISVIQPAITSCTDGHNVPTGHGLPQYRFACSTDANQVTSCVADNGPGQRPTNVTLQKKEQPAAP